MCSAVVYFTSVNVTSVSVKQLFRIPIYLNNKPCVKNKLLALSFRRSINMSLVCGFSPQGRVWWDFCPIFGQRFMGARLRIGTAVARGRVLLQSPVAFQPCSTSVGSVHFVFFAICGFSTAVVIIFFWVLSL